MDALVYEDTPLATYLEGEAHSIQSSPEPCPKPVHFAPRGLPDLTHKLRRIRHGATSITPGSAYAEELFEKFRYIVVASRLLSDEGSHQRSLSMDEDGKIDIVTLRGAVLTAVASFLAVWAIHWIRHQKQDIKVITWTDVGTHTFVVIILTVITALLGRRLYTNYVQRASARTLSLFIQNSHSLDATINNTFRFIQEVEVVARGYELGSPLPPLSRFEDRHTVRRCQTLRRELAAALKALTTVAMTTHDALQPHVQQNDVQRYHDIYEISLIEYSSAVKLVNEPSGETRESVKDLRFSMRLHTLARRIILCDLLALSQSSGWTRLYQWKEVFQILRTIETETSTREKSLSATLAGEQWGATSFEDTPSQLSQSNLHKLQNDPSVKMQLRQFDNIMISMRTLNAKMHLLRQDIDDMTHTNTDGPVLLSTLSKHYDSIGTELSQLQTDWERGKINILSPLDTDHERGSCSSSSIRTPASPSPIIDPVQVVDGGPADALRLLTGESPSSNHLRGIFEEEEEVFEAVAASRPTRKRMSISGMTREEKMARLAEDRRKRATLQEQAENTTNMLRELQMVIKHRPKGSLASNTPSKTTSQRIATL